MQVWLPLRRGMPPWAGAPHALQEHPTGLTAQNVAFPARRAVRRTLTLDLHSNSVGDSGAVALAALKDAPSLHCPKTSPTWSPGPPANPSPLKPPRTCHRPIPVVHGPPVRLPLARPPEVFLGGGGQGCIGREGTSDGALEAVRQAVEGGCQSDWGRLLSVANAGEAGTWRQGYSGWA